MASLRDAVARGETLMALGCGDPVGARVAAQAGFPAVYMSGYFASACIGYADVGLATMSEMVEQARRISQATPLPVIADIDNGYGDAISVVRTVREFEAAGVAAVHMEDQALPKKCGDLPGLALISTGEMCAKISAAVDGRRGDDLAIIARTDARDVFGLEEAIARGKRYRDAGADMLMIHGLDTEDEYARVREALEGPLVTTMGAKANISASTMARLGYSLLLYSVTLLRASIRAMQDIAIDLRRDGIVDHGGTISMADLHDFLGLSEILAEQSRYEALAVTA